MKEQKIATRVVIVNRMIKSFVSDVVTNKFDEKSSLPLPPTVELPKQTIDKKLLQYFALSSIEHSTKPVKNHELFLHVMVILVLWFSIWVLRHESSYQYSVSCLRINSTGLKYALRFINVVGIPGIFTLGDVLNIFILHVRFMNRCSIRYVSSKEFTKEVNAVASAEVKKETENPLAKFMENNLKQNTSVPSIKSINTTRTPTTRTPTTSTPTTSTSSAPAPNSLTNSLTIKPPAPPPVRTQ
tara:strand:- start:453 stop:1178 length:726 start_codon:yes stop_codon:yes gene_type:complete